MMKVGWLADTSRNIGGAELTQAEFRAGAPRNFKIVDCPPGEVDPTCDVYVVQNCVSYTPQDIEVALARPTIKYWHDVGPWLFDGVRQMLDERAIAVCCSPLQAQYMGLEEAILIPPPVDLKRFRVADNGHPRQGACSVGSWRNHGKAPYRAADWGYAEGVQVDFYGDGSMSPPGTKPVKPEDMPSVLVQYETFVFLPSVIEPFGRLVCEAWAAGCNLMVNELIGALYWIREKPEAIETAALDFWAVVSLAAEQAKVAS